MKSLASNLTHTLRSWNMHVLAIIVALGMAICCSSALAQSGAGSIQGTVQDSTRAVIPGATITVVNQATNVSSTTKSNDVGFYQVPGLFTGTYAVTVTTPNMRTYKTTVQLLVAQDVVINPVMTAGEVTQQVEVVANAFQLTTTDNGTITSTLENARINQLPLNGRLLVSLLSMTTPGFYGGSQGGTRMNGLSGEAIEFVADGVPMTNRNFGGLAVSNTLTPDPDAVQEVRMETSNSSAQYATPGTAVITTKSGTNHIHGALFETARNNAWGIAKGRVNPSNFAAPHLVRNEFGASAGGPIVIPKVYHGKDKSFWFVAYERYSLASGANAYFYVPTQDMRNGNFNALSGLASKPQLYDPATTANAANCAATGKANTYCRTAFANNTIPAGREAPTMKIINDITPLPNLTTINPLVAPNLQGPNPSFTVIPTWTFRLDHVFNEDNRAYLRYTSNVNVNQALRNSPTNQPALGGADGFPAESVGGAYNPAANFAAALGFTHVFSPSFFSETILSQQWFGTHNYAGGGSPNTDFEKMLGLPNNFGQPGFPQFGQSGSLVINPINGTQFIYGLSQILTTLDENLTKTVGKHQMQFGGRYRHERFGYLPDEYADGNQFNAQATGLEDPSTGTSYGQLSNTGNANGDAFLGAGNSYSQNLELPYAHYHDMEFDAYFQDDYHMTRNLTWNLGLRYEAHPATWVKDNAMTSFDLKTHAEVLASSPADQIARGLTTQALITNMENDGVVYETPAEAGIPSKMVYDYDLNFSPRVGFAYQPFGGKYGTVIRAGYGRYIFPEPVRTMYKDNMRNNPHSATYNQAYNSSLQSPDGVLNYLLRSPTFPVQGVNAANVVDSTSVNAILPGSGGMSLFTISPKEPPDFVTSVNFTIEQPLKGNSAFRISWIWTHGTNLDQEYFYNNHYSNFGWELMTGTLAPQGKIIGQPTYAATATGPYDQTVWASGSIMDEKIGWSNDNELQANYQKLYHNGVSYQIFYVLSKPFRIGDNHSIDSLLYPAQNFVASGQGTITEFSGSSPITTLNMPPARPAGIADSAPWHQLDAYEDYKIDNLEATQPPIQDIKFNGLYDLPFGRGKRFLSGANHLMDELVGGFQLAGAGSVDSQSFYVASGNWGPTNPIHVYKKAHKVTDCRSGSCAPAYEWFNGYIAPSQLPASGCTAVVSGLPSDWAPYSQPINTNYNPKTTCGTAADTNYNTNNVQINLQNGTTDKQAYSPGPSGGLGINPNAKTNLSGPLFYSADLSVFKVFPITESTRLRFNADAFNVFNIQGLGLPNATDGVLQYTPQHASSKNGPRQIQLTLRLEF